MNDQLSSLMQDRSRDPMVLAWYRFIRVNKKIFSHLGEPAAGFDISRAQFDLLMTVAFEEGLSQQQCANQMMVTKGNITQHIDRLEERGLIRREKCGRTNALHLTVAGRELVAQIIPAHDERVKEILSLLSEAELGDFQAVLRRLDRRLD
jgi:DNA-binding MarR family transcriptional regulator